MLLYSSPPDGTHVRPSVQVLDHTVAMRQTHSTDMNDRSSRSHAIFTLYITVEGRDHGGRSTASGAAAAAAPPPPAGGDLDDDDGFTTETTHYHQQQQPNGSLFRQHTRLNFVDLSGSENAKKSGSTGDRAREASFINQGKRSGASSSRTLLRAR